MLFGFPVSVFFTLATCPYMPSYSECFLLLLFWHTSSFLTRVTFLSFQSSRPFLSHCTCWFWICKKFQTFRDCNTAAECRAANVSFSKLFNWITPTSHPFYSSKGMQKNLKFPLCYETSQTKKASWLQTESQCWGKENSRLPQWNGNKAAFQPLGNLAQKIVLISPLRVAPLHKVPDKEMKVFYMYQGRISSYCTLILLMLRTMCNLPAKFIQNHLLLAGR